MGILIISTSLNPSSRSHLLAEYVSLQLTENGDKGAQIDLRKLPLPLCDGNKAYGDENVQSVAAQIKAASGIILASPIYNYDVNAAAKNLIELTGKSWMEKPVGFLCAAGGKSSYMSIMGIANSLMLDFRCHVLPRFVYSTGEDFSNAGISSSEVKDKLNGFCLKFREFVDVIDKVN
ncbi:MAG: NAD(P)H-dependent FMN reductase [Candidatus Marinamargulisbacteria bacterium]|jgi:NAD(P)H-dependent FMN reductase